MLDGKELRQQPSANERRSWKNLNWQPRSFSWNTWKKKELPSTHAGALALQLEGIVAKDSKSRTWKAHEKHGTGKKLRTGKR
jgi:hypothetical protein